MKLVRAHVTRYRSVEDSDEFAVGPGVTCLVGKNESGKTNVLQALARVNPVGPQPAGFDEDLDYPAKLNRERRQAPAGDIIPVVTATFRLDPAEVAAIEGDIGPGPLLSPEFTVEVGYRYSGQQISLSVDEAAVTNWLRSQLELTASAAATLVGKSTVAELLKALENLEEQTSATQTLAARIRSWRSSDVEYHLIDRYVSPQLPKFVYFSDYDAMPGKVSIPDLIRRRDAGGLSRGEQALLSLLTMAGAEPEEFHQEAQHERLVRALEIAGNEITDEVFRYWTQNRELEVELKTLPPEPGAAPPLHEGPILQVRVYNRRHRVSVAFDERSRGFVWFFSFLTYFNKLEETETSGLVLLLDEPGLSLHARAQQDLLRLIDERLAPRHQVIYSTHSPSMVSADHFDRVRTVIDRDHEGTKVSAEIFKADEDTVFPLLTAMGVDLADTLFVGEHTLLLEGPSDLIYLDVFSGLAITHGMAGLDPRWVKAPIGGSGKLSTFVTLLGANKLDVAVVVDSSTENTGAVRRLRDNGLLAANGLIEISEFTGTKDADIEDLFDRDFYLKLVSLAYVKELPAPLTTADINAADPRVVRAVEAYFAQHNIAGGKFNHYLPAAVLLQEQAALLAQIGQATITRAGHLLQRINALLA